MAENNEKKVAASQKGAADVKSAKTDKKAAAPKKEKVKLTARLAKFWRDYKSEFKKIVWPSKEETLKSTLIVVVSIVGAGAVIAVLDYLFSQGLTLLSHL